MRARNDFELQRSFIQLQVFRVFFSKEVNHAKSYSHAIRIHFQGKVQKEHKFRVNKLIAIEVKILINGQIDIIEDSEFNRNILSLIAR